MCQVPKTIPGFSYSLGGPTVLTLLHMAFMNHAVVVSHVSLSVFVRRGLLSLMACLSSTRVDNTKPLYEITPHQPSMSEFPVFNTFVLSVC